MKKILTVCILLMTVCLLCAGNVFADTSTSGQTYYIANENITVYVAADNSYQPALVIPKSYYFRTLSNNGNYTSIVYNNNDDFSVSLFISTADLNAKASVTKDNVNDDNAYFGINVETHAKPENGEVQFFNPGSLTYEVKYSYVTAINKVLGVYQYDNTSYFSAIVTAGSQTKVLLYKALNTNNPSFTLASIPLHQITIDRNNAQNEGVISTPGDGNTDVNGNNVIRNVMIAVICIMCVLVIFLIFRPTKNAKNRYEMENRENASDDKYGRDNYDDRR